MTEEAVLRDIDSWIMTKKEGNKIYVTDMKHLFLKAEDYTDTEIGERPDDAADLIFFITEFKKFILTLPLMNCGPMPPDQVEDEKE